MTAVSRRAALTAAALLAAAPRAALGQEDPDQGATEFLPPPAVFEQAFWAVCDHAMRSGTLHDREEERLFHRLRSRGDEHATAIETVLEGFGATPPRRPTRKEEVPLPGFHAAETRAHYLRFAEAAAQGAVGAWYVALQQLRQPGLLRLGAAAMSADGQHLVVIRGLLGKERLQASFETGRQG